MLKSMSKPKRLWMGAGFIMAVVSFTLWGYFWYAVLLDDIWQTLIARSEEELLGLAAARGFMQTVMSYLISALQAAGLLLILKMTRAHSFLAHQAVAAILSAFIALPVLGNSVLFAGTPALLWVLDLAHFMLGYAGMATVFFIFEHLGRRREPGAANTPARA